ncbi:urease accessory protein UreD [Vibrio sp.]|uniref:urease accessory protein UreD n=1 Tax=Vibrio sp. TaxID=678 RepID=UPI003D0A3BD0
MNTITPTQAQSRPPVDLAQAIDHDTQAGWKARLALSFSDRGDKTVIKQRSQQGPLAIQRPLYPEGKTCHTYLLHPPGGVVGGDTLSITATALPGAQALVTTPGATKFYRSNHRYARQTQHLSVASGARLEWLPQENIFFPQAHARLDTIVELQSDAQFLGWEMHCLGRPALNEGFSSGHLIGKTEIFIDGQRILTEGINLSGEDKLMKNIGLLDFPLAGTLYLTNQDDAFIELVQSLLSTIEQQFGRDQIIVAATQLEGVIVVRALAVWSEILLRCFQQVWQLTRGHWTGVEPDLPRIWAT